MIFSEHQNLNIFQLGTLLDVSTNSLASFNQTTKNILSKEVRKICHEQFTGDFSTNFASFTSKCAIRLKINI